ncbi:helix-turn-helix domain-containing protein [Amycolatopsis aidingensis]|uniref:PucR family transcriptional regulator n=1 Tax=Amycolatopsis aidingensis TaxID=2842453 RepID=UPI001E32D58B|nr:helix-turn-helix domain-containing protein [Amycolatopsis aidingensis]
MTDSWNDTSVRQAAPLEASYDSLLTPPGRHTGAGQGDNARVVRLWSLLPRELADVFRPSVSKVADEVLLEIQISVPEYAGPLEGRFGRTITAGVRQALLAFLDRIGDPAAPQPDRRQVFQRLGQHEAQQGRSLDVLQTAYRVGARVAWRRMSEIGTQAGIRATTLCLLAEAIFAYIDELSALSIEGYAAAQERAVGTLERRRRKLLDAVLGRQGAGAQPITELARAARWEIPERIVTVAVEPWTGQDDPPAPPFGHDVLMEFEGSAPVLVLAEPRDGGRRLAHGLGNRRAAVGPTVSLEETTRSLEWARRALRLVQSGVLPDVQLTWCERHLCTLWLLQDPFLVRELMQRTLAPLEQLKDKQYRRLSGTLLAWLETRGNVREVARSLAIHPQTVRARVQELQALFGAKLDDPQARFELVLALRARGTLGEVDTEQLT